MPRRGNVPKREILPDPHVQLRAGYQADQFSIMLDGKKGVAQKVVYGAFDIVKEKTEKDPLEVFHPGYGKHHAQLGGQGPPCRRRHLPGAHGGSSRAPSDPGSALADQLFPRPQRENHERAPGQARSWTLPTTLGSAVKKREDTHKMAEANKAFAHYRW